MKVTEKNGYKISSLTLGTVQLGIPYGINNTSGMPDYELSRSILDTARSLGITSFDTAKGYGVSESVLGRYFGECGADKTIITKIAFNGQPSCEVKDKVRRDIKDSMEKLGVKKLDTVLLHSERHVAEYGDILSEVFKEIKEEGIVSEFGISFSDKSRLVEYTQDPIYTAIQLPMNLLDSEEIRNGSIKTLSDRGVTVYVRSLYLQGLFFKDIATLPEKLSSVGPILKELRLLAEREGMSMASLALSYLKDAEGITSGRGNTWACGKYPYDCRIDAECYRIFAVMAAIRVCRSR
jgi:aryl-alcohol dehydrogenase-like predicted oxidoreductase